MRLKSTLLYAIVLAIASSAAFADSVSHRKAAEALMKESQIDKMFQSTVTQMLELQINNNPSLAPFRDTMETFFAKYISWEALQEDMISIYTEMYTEEELNQLLTFQRSPVGKKSIEIMPEITRKGMDLGLRRVRENQGELTRMVQEKVKQLSQPTGP